MSVREERELALILEVMAAVRVESARAAARLRRAGVAPAEWAGGCAGALP